MKRLGISPDLLAIETERVTSLLHQMVDLVIVVDAAHRVLDVSVQDEAHLAIARQWCNHQFIDVVGHESREKCAELFAQDAAQPDANSRWRHINLRVKGGGQRPYLMKFARMPRDAGIYGLILARDLGPVVEMQDRFQRASAELEQRLEDQLARRQRLLEVVRTQPAANGAQAPAESARPAENAQRIGATIVRAMVSQISHRSLEQIVAETTQILERLCISEAIERSDGDRARAAMLLGISLDVLNAKIRPQA